MFEPEGDRISSEGINWVNKIENNSSFGSTQKVLAYHPMKNFLTCGIADTWSMITEKPSQNLRHQILFLKNYYPHILKVLLSGRWFCVIKSTVVGLKNYTIKYLYLEHLTKICIIDIVEQRPPPPDKKFLFENTSPQHDLCHIFFTSEHSLITIWKSIKFTFSTQNQYQTFLRIKIFSLRMHLVSPKLPQQLFSISIRRVMPFLSRTIQR